jgi:hypothetical protein
MMLAVSDNDVRYVLARGLFGYWSVLDRDQAFREVFHGRKDSAERWARRRNDEEEAWERSIGVRESGSC